MWLEQRRRLRNMGDASKKASAQINIASPDEGRNIAGARLTWTIADRPQRALRISERRSLLCAEIVSAQAQMKDFAEQSRQQRDR